jgi:4-hydroxy-tetrahydrodipicolinate synthase
VSGRAWVIIHVGAATTAESKRLAAIAADYGADAVSVIAPYFISVSEAQIERHYTAIMDDARVPVLLYDVPMRTGNRVPSNVVGRLSRHPNCSGIKVSVDEIAAITEPLTHAVNNFSVYCGEDTLILDALEAGAAGFISGLANIVPETAVDLYRAFRNGDRDRAAQAQERLKVLAGIAKLGNGGTMVKRACELLGLRVGPSREPARIDPGVDAHLTQILAHAKLATTAAAQK